MATRLGAAWLLLLLLLLPATVQAQFNYTTNNGTITITEYTGPGGAVTIPDTINDLPVTSIGGYNIDPNHWYAAFEYCTSMTSVTIGTNITSIGNYAFNGSGLTSVTIPNSVTNIGDGAFEGCNSLTNLTIGSGVTNIGVDVFGGCASLTSVTIGTNVISIGDSAFSDCYGLASVTIPNGVTTIGDYAFSFCYSLASVTIGNGITSIGNEAFVRCTSLTSMTIPNSVTNIGVDVFGGCASLTGITVEALNSNYISVDGVLFDKSQTTLIQYPAGQTGASYTIPDSITSIGDDAFYGSSLTSVTIPYSVTSIGTNAFSDCSGLTSVTIPDGVTNIGDSAFAGCLSLTSVYFQGNAPSLNSGLFEYPSPVTGWPIIWDPATIYYLPGTTGWDTTFGGVPAFLWDPLSQVGYTTNNGTVTITRYTGPDTSWTIPSRINGLPVTSIGSFLCTSLTNVTIPSTVTNVADGAFDECTSLTAIMVDTNNPVYSSVDGVLFDKSQTALIQCPRGKAGAYTIPNSVTSIGDWAFYSCASLTGVYFQGNAPSVGSSVFDGGSATVYYLPGTTGWTDFSANIGLPTALWLLPNPVILNTGPSFGVQTNGFGFIISWATNVPVVVEACTNLANPTWSPVGTNTLTGGSAYFSDPQWTNYPGRFYRLRSP